MEPLPPTPLCRERMVRIFGTPLLVELELDWSLSFQPLLWCVQPVFRCIWCLFEHLPMVCLAVAPTSPVDHELLMSPMRFHTRSCPLRLRLLGEATYEPSVIRSNMDEDTAASIDAPVNMAHFCSVDPFVRPALDFTSDDVDSFLRSLTGNFDDILQDPAYNT
ncbi:hypothetical protein NDU88_001372 [Pleurodeles waltl]|uniref:Uncharacterized protein n=1 Tax=Pleurodeles waltl TaxID=8319 RepID=A0AAV7WLB2_PLEWA|nr:hypothetical protein NDU88_001372 [Pleurodeles waltl]